MKRIIIVLAAAMALASCGGDVKIKGHIVCGGGEQTILLESVVPGRTQAVDSVSTSNGKFTFRVKLAPGEQAIYNIRCGENIVPLLVSSGERIRVSGFGNVARTYTVSGSPGSEKVRELTLILNNGAARLDSLLNIYSDMNLADTVRQGIAREYARNFYQIKRDQIGFIVSDPGSLAAMYALYQRLPNDNVLFNGPQTDVVYYRLVADSMQVAHPGSPYLAALQTDIDRMTGSGRFAIDPSIVQTVNYPDINLPDMYGRKVRLSSLEGNVVLIDFWSSASKQCVLNNADLKEVYAALHPRGFEVYQVSVDTSRPMWVNTILNQKLPWVTVCDFLGEVSSPVRLYNVRAVPTNYLLDRNGNIVDKNLYGPRLAERVKALL